MDRHDLPDVTADDVVRMHVLDLAVSARHDVQFLTYWFDANDGAAFCLARAPSPDALAAVHRESHGQVPNRIIPVDEAGVLRFLGRIVDPVDPATVTSPFRTILFTDLKDSTSLLSDMGESAYMALLGEHDVIIRRALATARGREVKHTGDGVMASFEEVARALACAIEILDRLDARNGTSGPPALLVRIGLAAGEPVDRDDDLFGSTVNLASRICDVADPGQILVSEVVRDLGIEAGFAFSTVGARSLKGFPGSTALFQLDRA
jgi:class 3 adenylate cyclase